MPNHIIRGCDWLHAVLAPAQALPALATRGILAWVFIPAGWGKLHDLDSVIGYFRQLHIPAPELQAPVVAALELLCGVLLALGLATRVASLVLIGILAVAIVTAVWEPGSDPRAFIIGTDEVAYIVMLAWLATAGAGLVSLDHAIGAWRRRQAPISE
ncbi:MAG: DoxX family protein [Planctomycetes bacterium]|nr:DoxX family protein [Planctomycetota bacterium]